MALRFAEPAHLQLLLPKIMVKAIAWVDQSHCFHALNLHLKLSLCIDLSIN